MPTFKKFFQVDFVEDEDPMYQINDLPIFKLKTSVWDYSHELVDTGVTEIDSKLEDVNIDLLQNYVRKNVKLNNYTSNEELQNNYINALQVINNKNKEANNE